MPTLVVRPRSRIFHGHDWVFGNEVARITGEPQPGDIIYLRDGRDRTLGSAIYNPNSQIVARRISRRKQGLDPEFFRRRLERATAWRDARGIDPTLRRLVWSESDGLPGVVVDCYGPHVVLQTNTLAMDNAREMIAAALVEHLNPATIIERNDSPAREAEGLEPRSSILHGSDPGPIEVTTNGLAIEVDLVHGQKTGLYLDQLDNQAAVAALAPGRRVLDLFCNQGGFALACAKSGAASVLGLDISPEAVDAAARNAARNNLSATFQCANVFDALKPMTAPGDRPYDLIILDPPPFARNRRTVGDAIRGYKELHLRALRLLAPDGFLATYSCSHHVTESEFLDMVLEAANDAPATLRLVATQTQRLDHPVLPALPESGYLKGFVFQSIPAW